MNRYNKVKNKDVLFWKQVNVTLIARLYEVNKLDFKMFNYDPVPYFKDIGLPEKAAALSKLISIYQHPEIA